MCFEPVLRALGPVCLKLVLGALGPVLGALGACAWSFRACALMKNVVERIFEEPWGLILKADLAKNKGSFLGLSGFA